MPVDGDLRPFRPASTRMHAAAMNEPRQDQRQRQRSLRTVARWAAAVVVATIAAVAIGVVIADDDQSASARQVADVRRSCQEWTASGSPAGDAGWCVSMTEWMTQQLDDGEMSPQMMWGDANRLAQSCGVWMGTDASAGTVEPGTWCADMAGWMSEHMSGWSGWTMHGPMTSG